MRVGLMPIGLLVDEAARLTLLHLGTVYRPFAPVIVLTTALMVAGQQLYLNGLATMTVESAACGTVVLALTVMLLGYGALIVTYVAMGAAAVDAAAGRPVSVSESWRFAKRPAAVGTLIFAGICIFASAMACLVPVLYVGPILSLVIPVMLVEGRFGTAALSRSVELVRYNPSGGAAGSGVLRALLLMVAWWLVASLFAIPAQLPFRIGQMFLMFRDLAGSDVPVFNQTSLGYVTLELGAAVVGGAASALSSLFVSLGTALFYFDCRRRREGDDLAAEIDAEERRERYLARRAAEPEGA
jgi:hypothetical protein